MTTNLAPHTTTGHRLIWRAAVVLASASVLVTSGGRVASADEVSVAPSPVPTESAAIAVTVAPTTEPAAPLVDAGQPPVAVEDEPVIVAVGLPPVPTIVAVGEPPVPTATGDVDDEPVVVVVAVGEPPVPTAIDDEPVEPVVAVGEPQVPETAADLAESAATSVGEAWRESVGWTLGR